MPLEYAGIDSSAVRARRKRGFYFTLASLFAIGAIVLAGSLMPRPRNHYGYSRSKCASNMHQIGLGILLYTYENGGSYPDSLQTVAASKPLTPGVFVCPTSNDNPSTAPTTQQQVADLGTPGFCSYIYLGKGLTSATALPNQVILYEPLSHHGYGINVLCGDGHSEFIDTRRAMLVINAAKATTRPVMLPP